MGFVEVSRRTRGPTSCTRLFCTVTGIVALRPESFVSDLSISLTRLVSPSRYDFTPARNDAASEARPRQDTEVSRFRARPKGVTTRDGSESTTLKLSSASWVRAVSTKADLGSSFLRSAEG